MTYLVGLLIVALIFIIVVQIGKVSDLAAKIRGEEEVTLERNDRTAFYLVVFMIVFLIACVVSAWMYRNVMLGYGPWESSSAHGKELDNLFNVTLVPTGIVFVITHIFLFWYAYKYRQQTGVKAKFFPHDTRLEMIWTAIPAVVMAFLVVKGLITWNKVMPDVNPEDKYIEIEATAYQFAWDIRYAGNDNKVGKKDFRLINLANNSLGIDFKDERAWDDVVLGGSDKIVLPVDTMVRVIINAKDVLHNFYLPHFRVKMDAVPGVPTYFIFRPTKSTKDMREHLRNYPEWNEPYDAADPASKPKWEMFDYELACAELCGKGHYSMRRIVEIVSKEEYEMWKAGQQAFYATNIRGTETDPNKDKLLLDFEIKNRVKELDSKAESVWAKISAGGKDSLSRASLTALKDEDLIWKLKYVFYETGSSKLNELSFQEIDYVATLLKKYPNVKVEIGGHTDNTGNPGDNLALSGLRAAAVKDRLIKQGVASTRLVSKGYGDTKPADTNDTEEGKAINRRTELKAFRN